MGLYNLPVDRKEVIAAIRSLPDRLDALYEGLSDDELRRRPAPEEWSILAVCCHLRDAAQIEGMRIRRLLEEENPTLDPYDPEALARERNYQDDDPGRVRTAVRAFWGGLAYQLEGLSEEEWQRGGLHPESGPESGPVTVHSRAELMAESARLQLEQVRAVREQLRAEA